MSGAYVFKTEEVAPAVFYGGATNGQPPSPFVPDSPFGYSPSPYNINFPLPPLSPYLQPTFMPGVVPQAVIPQTPLTTGDRRERRPSWSGAYAVDTNTSFLQLPQRGHQRSYSAGTHPAPGFWPNATGSTFFIHPWLDPQRSQNFLFDLSYPTSNPRHYHNNEVVPVPDDKLAEPAMHPPQTRLHIECDRISNWPLDISVPTGITLDKLLSAIHDHLHVSITATDWNSLSQDQQRAVNKAYLKRCKSAGNAEDWFRGQGVKRVDYLCDKVLLRGLVVEGQTADGVIKMKMILS